ncbi:MAG: hypothetical protein WKF57_22360 [Nakamurella sp.]
MSLIYVIGIAGPGKTTVQTELVRRGYDARDIDSPDISDAYDRETGMQVTVPSTDARPARWFESHPWRTHSGVLQAIRDLADDRMIFLCGTSTDEVEKNHLYDTLICLDIDEQTLRNRITSRGGDNDFGKSEHELQQTVEWRKGAAPYYQSLGGYIVDATMPVDRVVDEIVGIATVDS